MKYTFDSAGWYWVNGSAWGNLNPKAELDDLIAISIGVNGGLNGYNHRKANVKKILKLMNVQTNCIDLNLRTIGIYRYDTSSIRNTVYGKKINVKNKIKSYDD